jgi:hypothetical protein
VDVLKSVPDGNKLTTSWTSSAGTEEIVTLRAPGELPAVFLARHLLDMSEAMQSEPPVP